MEKINNSDLEHSAVYSGSNSAVNFPLWWNSSGSHVSQSSYSKNLNLNVNSPTQCPHQMKHVGWQLQDPDSNPTQSTDQPHQEVVGMRTEDGQAQFISAQSDGDRKNDSHMKSVLSLGTPDTTYSASKFDYGQSIGCIPFSYREPYFTGVMAAYGQNTIIHPQMISVTSSGRVPLPLELTEDGPIYVNAKQYHGILRRRQLRAKLEAQNKLVKGRKPYLHESRHRHAMKRIRGSGGRFLDTKQLQQQQQQQDQSKQSKSSTTFTDGKKSPASSLLELGGGGRFLGSDLLQSKNANMSASGVSSGSEITDISNSDDMFQLSDHLRFAEFHPHVGGSMQGGVGMLYSGSQQRVPVFR